MNPFAAAESTPALSEEEYDSVVPALRESLLNTQYDVTRQGRFAALVLVAGMSGGGRSETANRLNEWMDPRYILTRAFGPRNDLERERPMMWRYWQALPPKGGIGVMLDGWYQQRIMAHAAGESNDEAIRRTVAELCQFETMLAREGVQLIKIWFHLSREAQRGHLAELDKRKRTRWRVTDEDRWQLAHYERFRAVAERTVNQTNTADAPWAVISGADARYRDVAVGRLLLDTLRKRLDEGEPAVGTTGTHTLSSSIEGTGDNRHVLNDPDLPRRLHKDDYKTALEEQQARLARLTRRKRFRSRSMVIVFEGMDAAGKGSSIRRITYALGVRQYAVVPISAPTEEERRYPYLWRFWRTLPSRGRLTIFDRSWYGRVLVERIEGFCRPADWQRAYDEINHFERRLVESDVLIAKLWLQIDKAEQLKRFHAREETPYKRFKITPDDWRNRKKWNAYQQAAADMLVRTSTDDAPWTLIEANDKYYARVKILQTLVRTIERALD